MEYMKNSAERCFFIGEAEVALCLPETLFFKVAAAPHSTTLASAATGGFSFFLSAYHTDNNRCNNDKQKCTNNDSRNIFKNPCNH